MQLHSQHQTIEDAMAEFIAAAFSPAEREIARLRAMIARSKPRSNRRALLESQLVKVRTRQLGLEVVK
jgi:hypothetical protein